MTEFDELKKMCADGNLEGAKRFVREEGTKCFTSDLCALDSVLWDAIRGGRLDVIEWYYETFGYAFTWPTSACCKLAVVAFRDATADTFERCEATADYVFDKFQLSAQLLDSYHVVSEITAGPNNSALGLIWLVRKLGAEGVYRDLELIAVEYARETLGKIKHVPQLQAVADYLRMSIAARDTRANRGGQATDRKQMLMIALQHAISLQYDLPVEWSFRQVHDLIAQCESFKQN